MAADLGQKAVPAGSAARAVSSKADSIGAGSRRKVNRDSSMNRNATVGIRLIKRPKRLPFKALPSVARVIPSVRAMDSIFRRATFRSLPFDPADGQTTFEFRIRPIRRSG